MDFGEKIKSLRERANMTRSNLAEAIGIKYSTLSNYENSVRQPDFETLKRISNFFLVSTDYLLKEDRDDLSVVSDDALRELVDACRKMSKDDFEIVMNLIQHMNRKSK